MLPSRFYPVVPDAGWVARLVVAGARLVQLRLKDAPEAEIAHQAAEAQACCRAHGARLVLNDHWRLGLSLGVDMLHLGQEDLAEADLPAIQAAGIPLGISTHSEAELDRALAANPFYVALGPIYPTTLKVMPWAPQGLERIGAWKRRIGARPLVAIGGISLDRAAGCLAAGADSIAAVSDIIADPQPEARLRAWLELVGEAPAPDGSRVSRGGDEEDQGNEFP
jgi:thiamine-phosphate pyrophosphorylase